MYYFRSALFDDYGKHDGWQKYFGTCPKDILPATQQICSKMDNCFFPIKSIIALKSANWMKKLYIEIIIFFCFWNGCKLFSTTGESQVSSKM